jgi:hypothetical protein
MTETTQTPLPLTGEDVEIKASIARSQHDRGLLVKTIVAMANTRGGRIVLQSVEGDPAAFDAQHLEELIAAYAEPRVPGLRASVALDGSVEITVPQSELKPHVFTAELGYQHKGRQRGIFFPGQIWVRHSSKNEPAGAEDLERMLRERASRFLGDLSVTITNPAFPLRLPPHEVVPAPKDQAPGDISDIDAAKLRVDRLAELAIRVTTDPDAAAVNIDINRTYPFTTSALGEAVGRGVNWAAAAVRALRLKNDLQYHYPVCNADGRVVVNKYSEGALQRVREKLASEPEWNPWAA